MVKNLPNLMKQANIALSIQCAKQIPNCTSTKKSTPNYNAIRFLKTEKKKKS
jgi:hypothetical protein